MNTKRTELVERLFLTKDGEFVIGQAPNKPLIVWFFAWAAYRLLPKGVLKDGAGVLAFNSALNWSLLELFSGVNLFRRILGFCTLVGILASKTRN